MKNIFRKLTVAVGVLTMLLSGCKEDDLGNPDRLFRPYFKNIDAGGDWIKLEWDKYEGAEKFTLEISTAKDSFSIILKTAETADLNYRFEGLEYDTKYYVRVKSVGENIESKFYTSQAITTDDYPTLLLTPTSTDIIDVAVKAKWQIGDVVYDRLDVIRVSNDSVVATVSVTPTQYAKGEMIISGLSSNTNHYVKAYSNGKYQGKKAFRTVAKQLFEGNVVDLRGMDPALALNALSTTLIDTIPDGTTVILDGGVKYKMPTLMLSKSVHFATGLSFYGKAILAVDANFDISASEVSSISFKDIFFTEGDAKPRNLDANYGGTYIFNCGVAGAKVGTITFEGCDIRYKRGFFRIKTGDVTIDKILINNCVFDSIAGYGIVNVDALALVKNITVTNSTISHTQKLLVNTKGVDNEKVVFSNNTIFSSPNGAQYMFDFNGKVVGEIEVKSNIFGPAYAACNGIRSSAKSVSIDGNYITSDFEWALNAVTSLPNAPIDPVEKTVSSSELFTDPLNFNFKLKVALKAGDPRWR
jgi:hypothetical protein